MPRIRRSVTAYDDVYDGSDCEKGSPASEIHPARLDSTSFIAARLDTTYEYKATRSCRVKTARTVLL